MDVKNILFIFNVIFVQICWTCNSKKEKESLSSYGRSNDYGFYLGDFIEETAMNGEETQPHQYPWMVFVCGNFDLNTMKCSESCGGTLIHKQYVLTAAHCVAVGTTEDTFVITGAHNVKAKMDMFDFVTLNQIILHPEYDQNREKEFTRSPDLAILKLGESVVFGPKVNAISLPNFSQVNEEYENKYGIVAGWGVRDYDNKNTPITSEDKLLEASVKIRSNSWCKKRRNLQQYIKR